MILCLKQILNQDHGDGKEWDLLEKPWELSLWTTSANGATGGRSDTVVSGFKSDLQNSGGVVTQRGNGLKK